MTQTATWTTYRVPETLPPDTEESVVGTEWHQEATGALADMLRAVADRRGETWGVCEQIALTGLQYPDGNPYDPRPDVLVLARPLPDGRLAAIARREAGAPLLIAEIASESTVAHDVGEKRLAYAAVGVREYVVYDPVGSALGVPLRAWRLEGRGYVPWEAGADGWWWSSALEIALRDTQPFVSVRDRDGTVIQLSREVRRRLIALEEERAVEARRMDEVRRRLIALEEERAVEARRIADLEEERAAGARRIADLEEQLRQARAGHREQEAEPGDRE